jgi:DMSO/TMAO reductase YedYZ molybdopterin-dependent catalytic subunit
VDTVEKGLDADPSFIDSITQ